MSKRMLIDATHKEETRVVVADDNRLLEFEYESTLRQQLRGNIFLAKVTRVEPSLQAAFVNFGGNRHGFLPFTEIHPDYYRIPIADREALLAEQREQLERARREEEEEDEAMEAENADDNEKPSDTNIEETDDGEDEPEELGGGSDAASDDDEADGNKKSSKKPDENEDETSEASDDDSESNSENDDKHGNRHHRGGRNRGRGRGGRGGRGGRASHRSKRVEMVGGDIVDGDQPIRPNLSRRYKIQEVVKRGQIMLVQVSKEERGNKGAAVTTYLSLPGRYCVLMPNSPRSGGVSRKIANYKDRKRLREILKEFKVPDGMSVIVRTAGVARTKTEIKRDLDYLMRLWDTIRSTTLESQAPALIYEEGELVKRAIRDIYDRDTEEVVVEGEDGYKRAREIMKMMIPSHVKRVKEHKGDQGSLFQAYQLEDQISSIGEMTVQLKSGGYLVIQQTEALVSIDVNSGRATKERHIEETALRTNLEAAVEVARQLRLRDLGGLVVIDFIDMEDRRNNGKVERKLKDALSTDRARLQVGRISSFGLLELSRQRISASLNETQFAKCPHCEGVGVIRTVDSLAIIVLRALESIGMEDKAAEVSVTVTPKVALYLLNRKRQRLVDLEERYNLKIVIDPQEDAPPSDYELEVLKTRREVAAEESDEDSEATDQQDDGDNNDKNRDDNKRSCGGRDNNRRSRRGGRNRRRDESRDEHRDENTEDNQQKSSQEEMTADDSSDVDEKPASKAKGRRNASSKSKSSRFKSDKEDDASDKADKEVKAEENKDDDAPKKKPPRSRKKKDDADSAAPADTEEAKEEDKPAKKTAKKSPAKKKAAEPSNDVGEPAEAEKKEKAETAEQTHAREQEVVNEPPKSKKKGWWSRNA
jgi:ribonuclease E